LKITDLAYFVHCARRTKSTKFTPRIIAWHAVVATALNIYRRQVGIAEHSFCHGRRKLVRQFCGRCHHATNDRINAGLDHARRLIHHVTKTQSTLRDLLKATVESWIELLYISVRMCAHMWCTHACIIPWPIRNAALTNSFATAGLTVGS
jgi:hypothetical protein